MMYNEIYKNKILGSMNLAILKGCKVKFRIFKIFKTPFLSNQLL